MAKVKDTKKKTTKKKVTTKKTTPKKKAVVKKKAPKVAEKKPVVKKKPIKRKGVSKKASTKRKKPVMHNIKSSGCGKSFKVDEVFTEVLCCLCTQKKLLKEFGWPDKAITKKKGPKRPAGWHFYNEFVDIDGTVFHKGVEQPDLFGTLDATPIKEKTKKVRISKAEKLRKQHEIFVEIHKEKKKLTALVKSGKKKGKKALQKSIAKLEKEVKKYL